MSDDVGSLTDELRKLGIALGRLDDQHDRDGHDQHNHDQHDHAGHDRDGHADDGHERGADGEPDGSADAAEAGQSDAGSSPSADQPMACRYCPVCQLIALARGQRTDSLDTLVSAATGLVSALTSYVEQKAHNESGPPAGPSDGDDDVPPRVERIDLQ